MRSLLCFLVLIFVSAKARAIVGGREVIQSDLIAESVVELIVSQPGAMISHCSGTLVSDHVVLTAAHCLKQLDGQALIGFGLAKRDLSAATLRPVDQIKIYPQYKSDASIFEDGIGDLALLHFDGEKPNGFASAKLISTSDPITTGEQMWIAGFGSNTFNGNTGYGGGILRSGHTIVDDVNLSPEEMLIGDDSIRTCFGDSGGASYFEENGEIVLTGVVMGHVSFSSAPSTGGCIGRSKFTKVQAYESWISATTSAMELKR